MTTPPKARKFRLGSIAGGTAPHQTDQAATEDRPFDPNDDGFGDRVFPGSAAHAAGTTSLPPANSEAQQIEEALAEIRREGLTGRQLRMARRLALKHGLEPASDFDAVRMLRQRGLDPFARTPMINLFSNSGPEAEEGASQNLPARITRQTLPASPTAAAPMDEAGRLAEIRHVQMEIARRRKRKLVLLGARLAFFVLLPTMLVGWYFYMVATPMYATNTEFLIQQAEAQSSSSGLGGLLGGSSFATVQESITVQSYLTSREAMLRLDEEMNLRAHFSDPALDPLTRLPANASDEELYDTYLRHLTIGYDPTEGLIKMEVLASDPETSQNFSTALITYAEERVDQMSQRLREDQMRGARESYEEAEANMMSARQRVIELQERRGILSADREVATVFQQISNFELQLQEERLRLSELLSNPRPNSTRVEVAERNIASLETLIESLRSGLTDTDTGETSLARVQSELMVAETDLETRQQMLSQALQQMEGARIEANRQTLYLSIGVFPIAPDEAAYPRSFENTLLAFLVFSGIYLLISMTASILREQVSA